MKIVYEAANAIEAHMLCDLLRQEGIASHVQGEHLQGAMGELPAAGLVRLVVDEADFDAGRAVIERWNAAQPADAPMRRPRSRLGLGLLVGLAIGVGCSYAYFRSPASVDGVDYNRDGRLDETWTDAASGLPLKIESDRDLDKRVDHILFYDAHGLPAHSQSDDDFDGRFETHSRFRNGQLESSEGDTDGDGAVDLRMHYRSGVLDVMRHIDPATGALRREAFYRLGVLQTAHVDTDGDGRLDTRLEYGALGEVRSRGLLPAP